MNYLSVEWLPLYVPSEAERADALLYANNVRTRMAHRLNVYDFFDPIGGAEVDFFDCNRPTTEHSYDDIYFAIKALQKSLPLDVANSVEMAHLKRLYNFSLDDLQQMLEDFTRVAGTDRDSRISIDGFCKAMGVPRNPYTERLFQLLDSSDEGSVDFRKYLAGMAMLSQEINQSQAMRERTLRFAFNLFDTDGNGSITIAELTT